MSDKQSSRRHRHKEPRKRSASPKQRDSYPLTQQAVAHQTSYPRTLTGATDYPPTSNNAGYGVVTPPLTPDGGEYSHQKIHSREGAFGAPPNNGFFPDSLSVPLPPPPLTTYTAPYTNLRNDTYPHTTQSAPAVLRHYISPGPVNAYQYSKSDDGITSKLESILLRDTATTYPSTGTYDSYYLYSVQEPTYLAPTKPNAPTNSQDQNNTSALRLLENVEDSSNSSLNRALVRQVYHSTSPNTPTSSPKYSSVKALLLYWDWDGNLPGCQGEVLSFKQILRHEFKFEVSAFPIPTRRPNEAAKTTMDKVKRFFKGAKEDELRILYYGGHGSEPTTESPFKLCSSPRRDKWDPPESPLLDDPPRLVEIPWGPIAQELVMCKSHLLWIPDCCYAMATKDSPTFRGTKMIHGASMADEKAWGPGPRSFTSRYQQALRTTTATYSHGVWATEVHKVAKSLMQNDPNRFCDGTVQNPGLQLLYQTIGDIWLEPISKSKSQGTSSKPQTRSSKEANKEREDEKKQDRERKHRSQR